MLAEESERKAAPKQESSQTMLQYWFPAWTGWYAGTNDNEQPAIENAIGSHWSYKTIMFIHLSFSIRV